MQGNSRQAGLATPPQRRICRLGAIHRAGMLHCAQRGSCELAWVRRARPAAEQACEVHIQVAGGSEAERRRRRTCWLRTRSPAPKQTQGHSAMAMVCRCHRRGVRRHPYVGLAGERAAADVGGDRVLEPFGTSLGEYVAWVNSPSIGSGSGAATRLAQNC